MNKETRVVYIRIEKKPPPRVMTTSIQQYIATTLPMDLSTEGFPTLQELKQFAMDTSLPFEGWRELTRDQLFIQLHLQETQHEDHWAEWCGEQSCAQDLCDNRVWPTLAEHISHLCRDGGLR